MKKYVSFCIVAVLSIATITVQAQPRGQRYNNQAAGNTAVERPSNLKPADRAAYMAEQLELTDAQKKKVEKLFEKRDAQVDKRRKDAQLDRETRRNAAEVERKAHDAELVKIIGNEKFQELQEMRIQRLKNNNKRGNMHYAPNQNRPNANRKANFKRSNVNCPYNTDCPRVN